MNLGGKGLCWIDAICVEKRKNQLIFYAFIALKLVSTTVDFLFVWRGMGVSLIITRNFVELVWIFYEQKIGKKLVEQLLCVFLTVWKEINKRPFEDLKKSYASN